jgi:hypothetical protein
MEMSLTSPHLSAMYVDSMKDKGIEEGVPRGQPSSRGNRVVR